jgi:hypothetical protein
MMADEFNKAFLDDELRQSSICLIPVVQIFGLSPDSILF